LQLKSCMNLSSLPCVLYVSPISYSLIWSPKCTSYEAPYYAVFCSFTHFMFCITFDEIKYRMYRTCFNTG
jgi:hypothetical protein